MTPCYICASATQIILRKRDNISLKPKENTCCTRSPRQTILSVFPSYVFPYFGCDWIASASKRLTVKIKGTEGKNPEKLSEEWRTIEVVHILSAKLKSQYRKLDQQNGKCSPSREVKIRRSHCFPSQVLIFD